MCVSDKHNCMIISILLKDVHVSVHMHKQMDIPEFHLQEITVGDSLLCVLI